MGKFFVYLIVSSFGQSNANDLLEPWLSKKGRAAVTDGDQSDALGSIGEHIFSAMARRADYLLAL